MTTQLDPTLLQVTLDIPLQAKEAQARGLPLDIVRLVVAASPLALRAARGIELLAGCVSAWMGSRERVFTIPIVPFTSDRERENLGKMLGQTDVRAGSYYMFSCETMQQVAIVLGKLECEELVLFFAEDAGIAKETLEFISRYVGKEPSHNAPFVKRTDQHGGILFYAASHNSIEVLGTMRFVLGRCCQRIWQEFL